MPLTQDNLLQKAKADGYAVGAFNANNMEIVQAIAAAAADEQAPVYIQASRGAIKYAGLDYIISLARTAAATHPYPMVLHLDHGDYEAAVKCIESGAFGSVMFDGSALPVNENVDLTQKIVALAHEKGILVEAEIGRVGGVEEDISANEKEARYTTAEEAVKFVQTTGCDSLAVAIGTAHGVYQAEPKLRFDLIAEIAAAVPMTPLVMHGSSGVSDEDLRKAVAAGISKINIDTDIRQTFVHKIGEVMAENPDQIDPREILGPAREAASEIIRHKIQVFGASGRAVASE